MDSSVFMPLCIGKMSGRPSHIMTAHSPFASAALEECATTIQLHGP